MPVRACCISSSKLWYLWTNWQDETNYLPKNQTVIIKRTFSKQWSHNILKETQMKQLQKVHIELITIKVQSLTHSPTSERWAQVHHNRHIVSNAWLFPPNLQPSHKRLVCPKVRRSDVAFVSTTARMQFALSFVPRSDVQSYTSLSQVAPSPSKGCC